MPIEADNLPKEAVDYLNQVEIENSAEPKVDVDGIKKDLLAYLTDWQKKSADWRKTSYEDKWLKWQRAADGVYDPEISSKKEEWQSKVHVGITASHRENIHAHIFRVIAGVNPPLEMKARFNLGEADQSQNIKDIICHELDKANWTLSFDQALHDSDTFGSGFMRYYWKTETAIRKLRKPVYEGFKDNLNPSGMIGYAMRAATGKLKQVGYEGEDQEVITYRGLKTDWVSIWDMFKTPKALGIRGSSVAIRYKLTYGDIVKGVQEGYYLPDCSEVLKGYKESTSEAEGKDSIEGDRGQGDITMPAPDYGQELTAYEFYGKLPVKWVYAIMGMPVEGDGERLVSARICFHEKCLLAVEFNDKYDGEPPVIQIDYMTKNGDSYGIGIPEMLESPQAVINEIVNQRLDNGAMVLNNTFAVVEKALVDPKRDLKSKPGQAIRLDSKYVPNGDARNAIMQLQISDTPVRAGFSEVQEWERFAQERTSANRVTLGTAGLVNDSNQTLGGQQMLKESAGNKFSYIGLKMELSALLELFHGVWETVYANADPEDIEDAIGPERAKDFILLTPEEVARDMIYMPKGVFTMENKMALQMRYDMIRKNFMGAPWWDDEKCFDLQCQAADIDPDMLKKSEDQILQDQAMQIPMEGQPGPSADLTGAPMPQPEGIPGPTARATPMTPDQIKAAYKSGAMTREMAVNMLRSEHGMA